jgi:siroheme synthase-like protein
MEMYPIFLKMKGVRCLVVGGGRVALRKVTSLVKAGALVTVVSPGLEASLMQLVSEDNITYIARRYAAGDVKGFQLVFAVTNDSGVNQAIKDEAQEHKVLCNMADNPEDSDFYVPSVVDRGMLQIAISTSGASPTLAHEIRHHLESVFGEDIVPLLEEIKSVRKRLVQGERGELKEQRLEEELNPLIEELMRKIKKNV